VDTHTRRRGIYEGIPFEYMTRVKRPGNPLGRWMIYAWGLVHLSWRLAQLRIRIQRPLIYLYVMDGLLNLYIGFFCRLLGFPVIQELCEWPPGEPGCSRFTQWLYRGAIFKRATGVLVISKTIEERVRKTCASRHIDLLVHRTPALFDFDRFAPVSPVQTRSSGLIPEFLYCGTWLRDVFLIIRAICKIKEQGHACKLALVGQWSPASISAICKFAELQHLQSQNLEFTGWVDEPTLHERYGSASALLMPLPDDDRSLTRMPNKLGEYLASGQPVITCGIGDISEALSDNENAYLADPASIESFARKMIAVISDPVKAGQIGSAGRASGIKHFHYAVHADALGSFFTDCIHWHEELRIRAGEQALSKRIYRAFRNALCQLAAMGLIATGCVNRARKRVYRNSLITGIYFHRPKARLFRYCIRWLRKHNYTFVSAEDLVQFLYHGKSLPKGAVWISFDDGAKELTKELLPFLKNENLPITLFIPSGILCGNGTYPWVQHAKSDWHDENRFVDALCVRDAMRPEEIKILTHCSGVTIGSHTVSHAFTNELSEDQLTYELVESKRRLKLLTSDSITLFAYPGSRYSGQEKRILIDSGYLMAAIDEDRFICPSTDPFLVPRLSVADQISTAEAICNMVGIWRPTIKNLKALISRCKLSFQSSYNLVVKICLGA
jgi:poly-beta-1,6-N-acetyl-D-glucosamine N-deacetylase